MHGKEAILKERINQLFPARNIKFIMLIFAALQQSNQVLFYKNNLLPL
jgi:hypothetical protein